LYNQLNKPPEEFGFGVGLGDGSKLRFGDVVGVGDRFADSAIGGVAGFESNVHFTLTHPLSNTAVISSIISIFCISPCPFVPGIINGNQSIPANSHYLF
jgi:hypothetical protein